MADLNFSLPAPVRLAAQQLETHYLAPRSITYEEIQGLGAEIVSVSEAEKRGGLKAGAYAEWQHALWLPTRLADNKLHPLRGDILFFKYNEWTKQLSRERRSVSANVAPSLAHFFPHPKWGDPGRVVLAESWIKGYVLWRAGKGQYAVIALNGIDGFSSQHELVANLHDAPWGRNRPDILFAYDTPKRNRPESENGIRASISRAMRQLAPVARSFYKVEIPLPRDVDHLGIDDYRAATTDYAVAALVDSAKRIGGSVDPAQYLAALPVDYATAPAPEPLAVVPGLLPCRSGVLFAPGGQRKSTLAMLLAAHVALGRQVWGRTVAQPGRVLYITGEDEVEDVQRTIWYMIGDGGLPLTAEQATVVRDQLHILDVTQLPGGPRISRKQDGAWVGGDLLPLIEQAVEATGGVRLVILDTLSALGLSETDGMNESAAAYHAWANRLARTAGVCVLALHHTGKAFAQERTVDVYGARGASALVDNARFALQLQRDSGTPEELRAYPAPESITATDRAGGTPSVSVYRLHVHKMRWTPYADAAPERPLWVRSFRWRYELFDALGLAAAEQRATVQQTHAAEAETSEEMFALVTAIERTPAQRVKTRELDAMRVPLRGKVIGQKRLRGIAEHASARGLLVRTELEGRGSPVEYSLPARKY